jgi:hypothetical protein
VDQRRALVVNDELVELEVETVEIDRRRDPEDPIRDLIDPRRRRPPPRLCSSTRLAVERTAAPDGRVASHPSDRVFFDDSDPQDMQLQASRVRMQSAVCGLSLSQSVVLAGRIERAAHLRQLGE